MKMSTVLNIEHLQKVYKNGRGVKDISLSVSEGEIVGLLGPNGSGKTTIMKTLVGYQYRDGGKAELFGYDPETEKIEALTKVGCLIEQPALYENLTAKRQLKMMARFYDGIDEVKVENILKEVGLERYGNEKARRFSLGMKQRLGIAMAFLSDPEFLILDEPANGLDIEFTVELRNRILDMAKNQGKSFLISAHQADEVEKMCDRVILLAEGQIIDNLTVAEILRRSPSVEDYFMRRLREYKSEIQGKGGVL